MAAHQLELAQASGILSSDVVRETALIAEAALALVLEVVADA